MDKGEELGPELGAAGRLCKDFQTLSQGGKGALENFLFTLQEAHRLYTIHTNRSKKSTLYIFY